MKIEKIVWKQRKEVKLLTKGRIAIYGFLCAIFRAFIFYNESTISEQDSRL